MKGLLRFSLAFVLLLPVAALAADPSSGTLSDKKVELTWSGGPFFYSNPAPSGVVKQLPCGIGQPACDNFRLTVARGIRQVLIAIAPDNNEASNTGDDYDLYVYDSNGTLIASDASGDGFESVVIDPSPDSAYYDVRVQPWLVDPGATYSAVASAAKGQTVDDPTECLEPVPAEVSIDNGETIDLSVFILLDGTDPAVAAAVLNRAAESYRPLRINLTLAGTAPVSYVVTDPAVSDSEELIAAAKTTMGGVPPRGVDLVGVFTSKTMQPATGGVGTVVGQADCIGGIRWDSTSFFVVSDIRHIETPSPTSVFGMVGLNPNVDATAEVFAHEAGHLMGAHHHYSNCVEGNLTSAAANDVSPCTLMHPAVNNASLNFAALEGATVRGHALRFAAP